jgi:23S rRNA (pseudouridine1915-N3)-methyltransferase
VGIDEFRKRLGRYAKIKFTELSEAKIKTAEEETIRQQEGELILKHIKAGDFVIVLDENGAEMSSSDFASYLEERLRQEVVFVVGGVYGVSEQVKARGDLVLSFSRFTFTHQMIRLLLFEQLYRAFNILAGGQYHK